MFVRTCSVKVLEGVDFGVWIRFAQISHHFLRRFQATWIVKRSSVACTSCSKLYVKMTLTKRISNSFRACRSIVPYSVLYYFFPAWFMRYVSTRVSCFEAWNDPVAYNPQLICAKSLEIQHQGFLPWNRSVCILRPKIIFTGVTPPIKCKSMSSALVSCSCKYLQKIIFLIKLKSAL